MSINQKTFTLNTGAKIPAVGFGTWQAAPGEAGKAVQTAIRAGYRHLDCAPLCELTIDNDAKADSC